MGNLGANGKDSCIISSVVRGSFSAVPNANVPAVVATTRLRPLETDGLLAKSAPTRSTTPVSTDVGPGLFLGCRAKMLTTLHVLSAAPELLFPAAAAAIASRLRFLSRSSSLFLFRSAANLADASAALCSRRRAVPGDAFLLPLSPLEYAPSFLSVAAPPLLLLVPTVPAVLAVVVILRPILVFDLTAFVLDGVYLGREEVKMAARAFGLGVPVPVVSLHVLALLLLLLLVVAEDLPPLRSWLSASVLR